MSVFGFVLILVTTVLVLIGTFFPGSGPMPFFVHTWWFIAFGGLLALGNLKALISALVSRKWSSLICHLGAALLFIGIARDFRTSEITARLEEGERITTYNIFGAERPLGFALQLADFQESGFVSRVRLDDGEPRVIRPSHPISYKGWLILQDRYEKIVQASRFILVSEQGETLKAETGQRFRVPGKNFEMEFDQDFAMSKDTMFRFQLYEQGKMKVTGFISRRVVMPPSVRPGVRLVDYSTGAKYVSVLQLVKRPGSLIAFIAFGVIFIGLVMIALVPSQFVSPKREGKSDSESTTGSMKC